jgi:histidinol-phosphate aminotransferase
MKLNPQLRTMTAYQPPWQGLDRRDYLRFDLGECTQPVPPHVRAALAELARDGVQWYPNHSDFMPQLAAYVGVDTRQLLTTNGSDQAIFVLLRALLQAGDTVLMAQPGFPIFMQAAALQGAVMKNVAYRADLSFPEDEFLAAVPEADVIVLINPNNPTGTALSLAQIEAVLQTAGADKAVIVDEAYYEFTGITAVGLLDKYPNLIITRTFSKAFALASLRLGYIVASPDLIGEFAKIRAPFDVNSAAITAAAAQLAQPTHWQAYLREVMTVSKPLAEQFFRDNTIDFYPGAAHFFLVKPADRDGVVACLKNEKILVFPMRAPGIENTFRMSVGTEAETRQFIEVYQACFFK